MEASSSESLTLEPSASDQSGGGAGGIDVAGTWLGTWQNSTPDQSSGLFEIEWKQVGSEVKGAITIDGTPCLTGGVISGAVNGNEITFGVVSGEMNVQYTGNIDDEDTMSGTYSTRCGNAEGDWTATRK